MLYSASAPVYSDHWDVDDFRTDSRRFFPQEKPAPLQSQNNGDDEVGIIWRPNAYASISSNSHIDQHCSCIAFP